ncbi:hypothetical protein Cgig2_023707 [Carnegiea gigantea]|uniref:Reverse transcriptase zinc-binding domain-containing protein n=1 Tax=Carnegiea gigantea TaxID=171969 RepID=A0A9Q1QK22_9CARY|nr:hypothetical protein Cgig2_023707 [Carnegiea gigantea]
MLSRENALSTQELDLVNRSNKKIKRNANGDPITTGDAATSMDLENEVEPENNHEAEAVTQQNPKISFRDKLAKNNPNMVFSSCSNPVWNNEEEYYTSEDDEQDPNVEEDPRCPTIRLTKEQKHRPEYIEEFGPWMMVKKLARQKNTKPNNAPGKEKDTHPQMRSGPQRVDTQSEGNTLGATGKFPNQAGHSREAQCANPGGSRFEILGELDTEENPDAGIHPLEVTRNYRPLNDTHSLSCDISMNSTNQQSNNLSMLVWNVQGAVSKEFLFTLKKLRQRYKPGILVLVETKISGVNADEVCRRIAYNDKFRVEANGFSRGIWVLWKSEFITMEIMNKYGDDWLFSAVYGSPQEVTRNELWHKLSDFAQANNRPWMLAGDFNDTRDMEERMNCGDDLARRCLNFNHWIENNGFIDLADASNTWRGILESSQYIKQGSHMEVGNGRSAKFWHQSWALSKPLSQFCIAPIPSQIVDYKVEDFWDDELGWKWHLFTNLLPTNILKMIATHRLTPGDDCDDFLVWDGSDSGRFSIKSMLKLIRINQPEEHDQIWDKVWKVHAPQRMRFFLWLVVHDRLMTNSNRFLRALADNPLCKRRG